MEPPSTPSKGTTAVFEVFEGFLNKKTRFTGYHERYFKLDGQALRYYEKIGDVNPKQIIQVKSIDKIITNKNADFDVQVAGEVVLQLRAKDVQTAAAWVQRLQTYINRSSFSVGTPSAASVVNQTTKSMPCSEEVDASFERFMDDKCLKPEIRTTMRAQLSAANKWQLVCRNDVDSASNQASHWAEALAIASDDLLYKLRQLHVVIRGEGKAWSNSFVSNNGLSNLLSILSRPIAPGREEENLEVILCLKSFMNNENGMSLVMDDDHNSITSAITAAFASPGSGDRSRKAIMDLLTAVCWLSEKGHASVLAALDNNTTDFKPRLRAVVQCLDEGEGLLKAAAVAMASVSPIHTPAGQEGVDVEAVEKAAAFHLSIALKGSVMTFVNALVNACDVLEERVLLRQELTDLGLMAVITRLQSTTEMLKGDAFTAECRALQVQCDLFLDEQTRDNQDTTHKELNLADSTALFAYLQNYCQSSQLHDQLLTALQSMLVASTQPRGLSRLIWTNISAVTSKATRFSEKTLRRKLASLKSHEDDDGEDEEAEDKAPGEKEKELSDEEDEGDGKSRGEIACTSYAQLTKFLEKTENEAVQSIVDKHDEVQQKMEAQKALVEQYRSKEMNWAEKEKAWKIEEVQLQASIVALQQSLEQAETRGVSPRKKGTKKVDKENAPHPGSPSSPSTRSPTRLASSPSSSSPPRMAVSSSSPARIASPAGTTAGGIANVDAMVSPMKLVETAPAAAATGVPIAPLAPPCPGIPCAPSAPACPGAPMAPGIKGGMVTASKVPHGLTALPAIKPLQKMKALHWTKMATSKIAPGTVWFALHGGGGDNASVNGGGSGGGADVPPLDGQLLTQVFGVSKEEDTSSEKSKEESEQAGKGGKFGAGARRSSEITLVDSRRSYNINITLASLGLSSKEVELAIREVDFSVLNEEKLEALLKCLPTSDEMDLVAAYEGDATLLGKCEQFFLCFHKMGDSISVRLKSMLLKHRFDSICETVEGATAVMLSTLNALYGSKRFQAILKMVLDCGNYMNAGTAKGDSYGFALSSLVKLADVKSADGNMSVLDFVVNWSHQGKVQGFAEDFSGLKAALRIDVDFLHKTMNECKIEVTNLNQLLSTLPPLPADGAQDNNMEEGERKFVTIMTPFQQLAASRLQQLASELKDLDELSNKVLTHFGETKTSQGSVIDMLTFVQTFVLQFASAEKKRRENKKAFLLEQKQKASAGVQGGASSASPRLSAAFSSTKEMTFEPLPLLTPTRERCGSTSAIAGGNQHSKAATRNLVDNVMTDLGQGDSTTIANIVHQRRQARRAKNMPPPPVPPATRTKLSSTTSSSSSFISSPSTTHAPTPASLLAGYNAAGKRISLPTAASTITSSSPIRLRPSSSSSSTGSPARLKTSPTRSTARPSSSRGETAASSLVVPSLLIPSLSSLHSADDNVLMASPSKLYGNNNNSNNADPFSNNSNNTSQNNGPQNGLQKAAPSMPSTRPALPSSKPRAVTSSVAPPPPPAPRMRKPKVQAAN